MSNAKFNVGRVVMSQGISSLVRKNSLTSAELITIISTRHVCGDFGDLCTEDKAQNNLSIKNGGRILSKYTVKGITFYVITEADRSVTTFLLPEEY